jgi:hypothetical protein
LSFSFFTFVYSFISTKATEDMKSRFLGHT